jgi:tetratricopeptide (TPR) repeat protein
MPRLATVCLFGLLLPGIAAAETRFPRVPRPPAPAPFTERVRPPKILPDQPQTLPPLSVDVVFSVARVQGPNRDDQERILADLIANTPDSAAEEKADYYFRLGELYVRQMLFWQRKAKELPPADREARSAIDKSKMYLLKTVKTYKGLTDNTAFANYPKLDLALFTYGYALQAGKYMREARAVYDKLLKTFPTSKYAPEAHLAFAEYYLEVNQLADAKTRYEHVLKLPTSSAYWFAMYRLGAIDVQLQRSTEALERFLQVARGTKSDPNLAAIHRAATLALARSAAGVKPEDALAFAGKLDKARQPEMMAALATRYFEQGAFESSIKIHRELLRAAPASGHACGWNYDLSRAMLAIPSTKPADQVKQVEALVASYAASKNLPSDETSRECHDNAAAMASELARAYHVEAAKTNNAETLDHADRLYRAYLAAFPDAADRTDASVSHGELLWVRADREPDAKARSALWERAADAFALGASRPDIANAATLAWLNALDFDPDQPTGPVNLLASAKSRVSAAQKPPARIAKFLGVADALAAALDRADPQLPSLQFLTITLYRKYRHDDEAISRLEHFLDDHREHAHAEIAANLLLDTLVRSRRHDDLREILDLLATDLKFIETKPGLVKNITLLRSRSP